MSTAPADTYAEDYEMGFIIRTVFWFSLVLLIIPIDTSGAKGGEETIGPLEAFFAARAAISDMTGMCERQPQVCAAGRSAMHTITVKGREAARIAFSMLDDQPAEPQVQIAEDAELGIESIHTGTINPAEEAPDAAE